MWALVVVWLSVASSLTSMQLDGFPSENDCVQAGRRIVAITSHDLGSTVVSYSCVKVR